MQVSSSSCSYENLRSRFANRSDVTALLAAFCFFLSAIEYMLPKPLPFMRLGIANLPILLAVDFLPFKWFLVLAAAKVVGMSIVSGTLFSYVALFSLAGTMVAALVMRGVRWAGRQAVSLVGVSIAGAVTSNAIQMLIARYVIFGEVAWLIAPIFLLTGLITGTLMGFFAEYFVEHSHWYACATDTSVEPQAEDEIATEQGSGAIPTEAGTETISEQSSAQHRARRRALKNRIQTVRRQHYEALVEPWMAAVVGVGVAIVFLLQQGLFVKTLFLFLFILWTWLAGKRFSLISTLIVMLGIVATNLLIPSGRVLLRFGPIVITEMALSEGLSKALTFEGLMYLSKAAIMPGLQFPGKFGAIIAKAFQYYDQVIEYRGKVHAKTVVRDIDVLLQRVWFGATLAKEHSGRPAEAISAALSSKQSRSRRSIVFALIIFSIVGVILVATKMTGLSSMHITGR
jgi:heptaprenyl diphosphate synthase